MNISKKQFSLIALPLLAVGIIGISALALNHTSAESTSLQDQIQADKAESSDTPDTSQMGNTNDTNSNNDVSDTQDSNARDNKQAGVQGNQNDSEATGEDTTQ